MYTTLNKIRSHLPCEKGWKTLLKSLGKTEADDEPLPLLQILESNGLFDALWCIRAVDGFESEKQLLAVAFAREVEHMLQDSRLLNAINVAEKHAKGLATKMELKEAWYSARAAHIAGLAMDTSYTMRYATAVARASAMGADFAPYDTAYYVAAATRNAALKKLDAIFRTFLERTISGE